MTPHLAHHRIAAPAAAGRDAAEEEGEARVAGGRRLQANVSTAYCSTGERDQDDGGRFALFLADVKPCIGERSAQPAGNRVFGPFPQKKTLTKWGASGIHQHAALRRRHLGDNGSRGLSS
jgi:hypothetical protein